jgi:hypothetical protein
MIAIHVQRHWVSQDTWFTPVGQAMAIAGGPMAAPTFMLLMGASLAWSRRTSTRALVGRGFTLLLGGYVLNLFRGPLAIAAGQAMGLLGPDGKVGPYDAWWVLTIVDILQLAGISLVMIAGLRRVLPARPLPWIAVAVGIVVVTPLFAGIRFGQPVPDAVLAILWKTAPNTYYPAFAWSTFPILGVAYGMAVRNAVNPAEEIRRWAIAGLGLAAIGVVAVWIVQPGLIDADLFWAMPIWLYPGILGLMLPWLGLSDILARRFRESMVVRFLDLTGRRVTRIYVIHWMIVAWGIAVVGYLALSFAQMWVAIVVVATLAHLLAEASIRVEAPLHRVASAQVQARAGSGVADSSASR